MRFAVQRPKGAATDRGGSTRRITADSLRTLLLLAVAAIPAPGQLRARPLAYPGVDADGGILTLPAALRTMAAQAGVIFVGTVSGVRRVYTSSAPAVEITFLVEQPVRGVTGPTYILREWGGLVPLGQRPFLVGDRRLMLLHPPASTGFSSPVGGFEGAIPVVGTGTRVRPLGALTADAVDMLDLRWVAAKLVHPLPYASVTGSSYDTQTPHLRPPPDPGSGIIATHRPPAVLHGTERGGPPVTPEPTVTSELPLASVLAMLTTWTAAESRAR